MSTQTAKWVLAILLFIPAMFAQNAGVISGIVTDASQAVVPNANVAVANADTGVTMWRGTTNGSGV